jgi:hypothetical protein
VSDNHASVRHFRAMAIACQVLAAACSRTHTVELARQTTLLSDHPLALSAREPLVMSGSSNELCLQIIPPDSLNWNTDRWEWGVRRSDGVLVKVGAALLHADSSVDTISAVGYSGIDCLAIGPSIYDTLRPPFAGVRITVTDSLSVARITWFSWTGP